MATQKIEFCATQSGTYTNITPFLEFQGLEIETEDLCSDNQVTTLAGKIFRGKFAERSSITLTFRALTDSEMTQVENFLKKEYFYIKYIDPKTGQTKTSEVFCDGRTRGHLTQKGSEIIWGGLAVTLTERNATG